MAAHRPDTPAPMVLVRHREGELTPFSREQHRGHLESSGLTYEDSTAVTTANVFKDVVNFVNNNPETGSKYLTQGRMIIDIRTGDVHRDQFELRYVRPGS